MKRCGHCKLVKLVSEFNVSQARKYHLNSLCKDCVAVSRLRYKYHLNWSAAEAVYNLRNGECHLCDKRSNKPLCLDHDHHCCKGLKSCGKCIRGLLCMDCNRGLGQFKDNPLLLRRAADYIEVGGVQ